jgi:four helix bundle protein
MKNFRTYQLAVEFYRQCQTVEINEPIKNQFQRATLSIVLNLAEGTGKMTPKDKRKFYSIAMGSLRETQCILELINRNDLYEKSQSLAASLYKLIQSPGGSYF